MDCNGSRMIESGFVTTSMYSIVYRYLLVIQYSIFNM